MSSTKILTAVITLAFICSFLYEPAGVFLRDLFVFITGCAYATTLIVGYRNGGE